MKARNARTGTSRSFTNLAGTQNKRTTQIRVTRSATSGEFTVSRSGSGGERVTRQRIGNEVIVARGDDMIVTRRGDDVIVSQARRKSDVPVSQTRPAEGQPQPRESRSTTPAEDQVQAEAAKLRQITDRKLGKTTPAWVSRIAGQRS